MAPTHVELYEALRPYVGDEAAQMMAEVIPPAADLATKLDIADVRTEFAELRIEFAELRTEFAELRGEMREGFATLRAEIKASQATTFRYMIAMFVPVWAATWATVVAVILKL